MSKYQIKIELLSDLCVSDGGAYNSMLDLDVCYDRLGLPYIPAKRLRGCLREAALELNDWGKRIDIDALFGKAGDAQKSAYQASARIFDAHLEAYHELSDIILKHKDSIIFHPQNVLNHYSYIRTQTAIDHETGVADEKSLRTMRVVNKGEVFIAEVELDEEYKDDLETCCKVMKHMGISRSRGLGEVKLTLEPYRKPDNGANGDSIPFVHLEENADILEYRLRLEEPVICKSVAGGEARSLDYIDGGKIYGLIAQHLDRDIIEFTRESQLICSNAYLSMNGKRMSEVPATYYSIKNDNTNYVNKAFETAENKKETQDKQLNLFKHCYIADDNGSFLVKKNVKMEENYHHRRPEDKSIGRAVTDNSGNSMFYQMSAIAPFQEFKGFVLGTKEQMKAIAEALQKKSQYFIGYSRSSEYGRVTLLEIKGRKIGEGKKIKTDKLIIKLESPTIIYNEKAMYSTNSVDLQEEVMAALGLEQDIVKEVIPYVNYTEVGGYNVTWHRRKPTIECFDKGTVLIMELENEAVLTIHEKLMIGERCQEGYGEITVDSLTLDDKRYICPLQQEDYAVANHQLDVSESRLAKEIADDLYQDFLKEKAIEAARKWKKKSKENDGNLKPLVSNMISMVKDKNNKSLPDIRTNVDKRYDKNDKNKKKKRELAHEIIKVVEEKLTGKNIDEPAEKGDVSDKRMGMIDDFAQQYELLHYSCDDPNQNGLDFLIAFLTELKYSFRTE